MKPPVLKGRRSCVFLTGLEFSKPELFPKAIGRISKATNLSDVELWEFREYALDVGQRPVGLFIWMIWHADRARGMLSDG